MANPVLDQLTQAIQNATTVEDSAVTFINGIPQLINDAVQKAIGNGATEEQLQPFTQLSDDLQVKSDALVAAMQANT